MTEQELRSFLSRVEMAMRSEGCTADQVQRVLNWLIYGNPLGAEAHIGADAMKIEVRRQVLEAYNLPELLTEEWAVIHDGSGDVSGWGELVRHDPEQCYGPEGQPWGDGMCRCLCTSCEECGANDEESST